MRTCNAYIFVIGKKKVKLVQRLEAIKAGVLDRWCVVELKQKS